MELLLICCCFKVRYGFCTEHCDAFIVLNTCLFFFHCHPDVSFYFILFTRWRKGAFQLTPLRSQSIMEGNQKRNSKQNPGCSNWRMGHGRVPCTGIFSMAWLDCFLILSKATCLGVESLSSQLLIKKIHHRFAHQPIWWEHSLFLFY